MKIYKTLLILLYVHLNLLVTHAQDQIWYFGNEAGIDFNGNIPVALNNSAMSSVDYSATISDAFGNILFYTNSLTVWDRTHSVMQNGTGLQGQISNGQCAIILQQPGTDLYYIFTVGQYASNLGFRYHTVDMSMNGGNGAVVIKNNLLLSPSTEKIDAVYNPSDNSYWIVTHGWDSNEFFSYKLTATGLNTVPVISAVGTIHSNGGGNYNAMGQLCISPLKDKIVCGIYTSGIFELFDFNINTGIISNPITLTGFFNAWGAAFSPDETKIYVKRWLYTPVYQMEIISGDDSTIMASSTIVGYGTGPGGIYQVGYLQLAPDNKIYGAVFNDGSLLVINDPNAGGLNCNLIDDGFYLNGKTSSVGLCRTIKGSLTTSASDVDLHKQLILYPNPVNFYLNISGMDLDRDVTYEIYDLKGSLVKKDVFSGILDHVIDVRQLNPGLYIIRLIANETVRSEKILVE